MITALDTPRRCLMCGVKIHLCMGFVLARDVVPIIQAQLEGRPVPRIKVRELCGRCVFIWDKFAQRAYEEEEKAQRNQSNPP